MPEFMFDAVANRAITTLVQLAMWSVIGICIYIARRSY